MIARIRKYFQSLNCFHIYGDRFWVGNSDVRPFQVEICKKCGKHRYTYQG